MVKTIATVDKKIGGRFVIPRFARCRSTERNHWRRKFNGCLKSFATNQNAKKLVARELFSISRLLRLSEMKRGDSLPLPTQKRGQRKDVFNLGVPVECLRDSLQDLFAIVQTNNSTADYMSSRSEQDLLIEAQETLLRNFVNSLEFDEDNNVKGIGLFPMHWLVAENETTMLRLLLERKVNMDKCDSAAGRTPFNLACAMENEEIVALFMYYNVSPNAPLVEMMGDTFKLRSNLICAAAQNDNILGMLIEYALDRWSDVDINILMMLMFNRSRYFSKFVEIQHTTFSSTSSIICHNSNYSVIWDSLYIFPNCYLKEILVFFTKNKKAFDQLMAFFSCDNWHSNWSLLLTWLGERQNFFENLHVLADTVYVGEGGDEPKSTFLQAMINKIYHNAPLASVMSNYGLARDQHIEVPLDEIESIILVLLSNGAPMDDYTMDLINLHFDDPKFFNFCRLLHVSSFHGLRAYHATEFYHKFPGGKTIWQVVNDPSAHSEEIESHIDYYTSMSSHPNVKEIAYRLADSSTDGDRFYQDLKAKVDAQPEFPTLLELARDAARTYVVEEYRVRRSWQFYEAVKRLEIPEKLKRIIEYDMDTPLYS